MNVIIRLQNLPWSANAMDIRQYFQGLAIPDGGVHIVGGEMGDAFIAFSTDEDARQAMMLDRGKLKEVQVRLLLSSRTEMQKVIETARQSSLAMIQATSQTTQPNNQIPQMPQPPVITPTSLNKILSQQPNEISVPSYQSYMSNQAMSENSMDTHDRSIDRNSGRKGRDRDRFGRSSKSRSKSRDRRRSRSRDRGSRRRRDHSRSRSRDRRNRRRRSRSNDRGYDRNDVRNRDRNRDQKDRDMGNKYEDAVIVGDENETNGTKSGKPNNIGNTGIWNVPPQPPAFQTNLTKGYNTCSSKLGDVSVAGFQTNQNMFNPMQQQQQQQFRLPQMQQEQRLQQQQQQPVFSSNMHLQSSKDQNDQNKPIYNFQSFFKTSYGQSGSSTMGNGNNSSNTTKSIAFQNPYTVASMSAKNPMGEMKSFGGNFSGMFNKNDDSKKDRTSPNDDSGKGHSGSSPLDNNSSDIRITSEINFDELEGNCIKIRNMCPSTTYSELRRFFSGLYIANNGIKMVNDTHGLRIGVAYVRFVRRESKPKAFIRNGMALKSKNIVIESVNEDDFEAAVDSFKPTRRFGNNRYDDESNEPSSRNRDSSPPSRRNDDQDESAKFKFNNLYLENVPIFAKEQDIMKMFSSYTLTDIVLTTDDDNRKQLVCFVKFHRAEDAKNALEETATHMIGHKKVFVSPCSDERFDKAKDKFNMREDEEEEDDDDDVNEEKPLEIDEENSNERSGDHGEADESNEASKQSEEKPENDMNSMDDGDSNKKEDNSNSNDPTSLIPSLFSLNTCPPSDGPTDPRRRGNSRQGTRFSRPDDNKNTTNYILIKNCDYKSTKRDFVEFFAGVDIIPTRVEIIFNARNQPSGECICEFESTEDAEKSLFKTNYYCGNRSVRIELISPQDVSKRLGDDFVQQNSNNGGINNTTNMNSMPPMNNNGMNNNFNSNILNNFMSNKFGNNNTRGGGGGNCGFNDNFNNFQSQQDSSFRNNNNNNSVSGGGDRFNNNRNNRGGGRGPRQSRFSDFDDNNKPSIGMNMNNVPNNQMSGQQQSQLPQILGDTSVDQFGQPGCVIGMENVPYKASIDDILDFFKQFNIQPHNVIRRYNDDGTPTGDARVAFNSPMQARTALESKRQQKILNRTIFLSIV